jgi:hypothetical protein
LSGSSSIFRAVNASGVKAIRSSTSTGERPCALRCAQPTRAIALRCRGPTRATDGLESAELRKTLPRVGRQLRRPRRSSRAREPNRWWKPALPLLLEDVGARQLPRRRGQDRRRICYDGTWVLRTNTELDAAEVALQYKRLWMPEQCLRSCKSLIHLPPARYAEPRLTAFVAMELLPPRQHFPLAGAAPQPHSSILT